MRLPLSFDENGEPIYKNLKEVNINHKKQEEENYKENIESGAEGRIEPTVASTILKRKLSEEQLPITLSVDHFIDELCIDIDAMDIDDEI